METDKLIKIYIVKWTERFMDIKKKKIKFSLQNHRKMQIKPKWGIELVGSGNHNGVTTKKEWFDFVDMMRDNYNYYYQKLLKYTNKNKPVYLHSSPDIEVKVKRGAYFWGGANFNPNGIWFSVDANWFKWHRNAAVKHNYLKPENKQVNMVNLNWLPWRVYKLDISELNLMQIKTCKDLRDFSEKYKNKSPSRKNLFSLTNIKKDYDGVVMCEWIAIKCNKFFQKHNAKGSASFLNWELINAFILDLIKEEDKNTLWSIKWDTATGVILKNYNKIKYEKLDL